MSSLPPEFREALALLAGASADYREATGHRVVIVGGAAVSFYTQGAILSGDVDMVTDIGFEPFLIARGFVKENRANRLRRGYFHPDLPTLGFEFVSGALFDGRSDRDKLLAVPIGGSGSEVIFPAIEDLIADRLGQYASSKDRDTEMLEQARLLFSLASDYDPTYLKRRITEESGDPAAIGLG
jgi:hypothetical protein